jgi:hypothetical protein
MSCSDILLSFLSDAGENWADAFIFPECDTDELIFSEFLGKKNQTESDCIPCLTEDDTNFKSVIESILPISNSEFEMEDFNFQIEEENKVLSNNKKRHLKVSKKSKPPKKYKKLSPEEKIGSLINLIRLCKKEKIESNTVNIIDPDITVRLFLTQILCNSATTSYDFFNTILSDASLNFLPLSSLYKHAQSSKATSKLTPWAPIPSEMVHTEFPSNHKGIGQISTASRAFSSTLRDLISPKIFQQLTFSTELIPSTIICSSSGHHFSSKFNWKSNGLISLGYSEEIEFNGLIRCSLVKEGIKESTISFDSYRVISQVHQFYQ